MAWNFVKMTKRIAISTKQVHTQRTQTTFPLFHLWSYFWSTYIHTLLLLSIGVLILTVDVIHDVTMSEKVLFREQNNIDCLNSNLEKTWNFIERSL